MSIEFDSVSSNKFEGTDFYYEIDALLRKENMILSIEVFYNLYDMLRTELFSGQINVFYEDCETQHFILEYNYKTNSLRIAPHDIADCAFLICYGISVADLEEKVNEFVIRLSSGLDKAMRFKIVHSGI